MLHRACSFEIRRSWTEMNSTMLRTKLLNDKSSNIYKITKCLHSGSVSAPRGKPVWWWSTGQAACQGLHCTGTSPLHPVTTLWVTGEDQRALRAHRENHQSFWECPSFCPIPIWPCLPTAFCPRCMGQSLLHQLLTLHLFPSDPSLIQCPSFQDPPGIV